MSKEFSLDSIFSKKGHIFVQGASRESIITKLHDSALTTPKLLDQVGYLYQIKLKADDEIEELRNILAERLRKEEFGFRNFGVGTKKLQRFIDNTEVFEWFSNAHPDVADKMEAGLAERRGTPMSTDERILQMQKQLEERDRVIAQLRENPHQPQKRARYAEPGASSGREESDGRDGNGSDSLDDDVDMDCTGGGASVATNIRETIEREVRAEYHRKLAVEVQKVKDDAERQLAIRSKEIEKDINRKSLLADQKRIQDMLDAYQRKYDTEKDKWTTSLQAATDSAEKQRIQSKLDKAKTNYDTYVKRQKNAIERFNNRIQILDETGDMGGPSSLDEMEDMGSAFE
ncbi:hypothetical protein HK104_006163 [Borealophlyctis nickersoniae]|nr:hypothetical protein HK104_006163 [Borealophlyctis nickersoniae]